MNNQLYLVTLPGERHEDHIPLEFCDFETLRKNYVCALEEKTLLDLADGESLEIDVVFNDEYQLTDEDKKNIMSDVEMPDMEDCWTSIYIIPVRLNVKIIGT